MAISSQAACSSSSRLLCSYSSPSSSLSPAAVSAVSTSGNFKSLTLSSSFLSSHSLPTFSVASQFHAPLVHRTRRAREIREEEASREHRHDRPR
ncbi:unnamed protein product [Cochlearia groenlandica]